MRIGGKFPILILLLFLGVWLLGRCILPFFMPFLLGAVLALAAEPVVGFLSRSAHLPRSLGAGIGVTGAFCLGMALLLSLGAVVVQQFKFLAGILPDLQGTVRSGLSLLEHWLLRAAELVPRGIRPLLQQTVRELFTDGTAFLRKAAEYVFSLAGGLLTHLPDGALTLGTTVISGFMISARLPLLKQKLRQKLSGEALQPWVTLLQRVRHTLGCWVLAQLKLAFVTWLLLTAGLILLAIPYAPLWALAITFLDALPVLGTGTVLLPWCLIALLSGDRVLSLGLLGTYITISVTRTVLEPRMVGKQLGLDPLLTLTAFYAGYRLWGIGGMLLAPLLCVTALQLVAKDPAQAHFQT